MGWASYAYSQEMAVTCDISIKFLRPTYISDEKLTVICQIMSKQGPKINMKARLLNKNGEICTKATGTYHILHPVKYNQLIYGNR
jgi:acyl-coenzyme A thioesterase PaaI-like protein